MTKYIIPLCIAGLLFTLTHILPPPPADPRPKGQMVIVTRPLGLDTALGGLITLSKTHSNMVCKPHGLRSIGFAIANPSCYSKIYRTLAAEQHASEATQERLKGYIYDEPGTNKFESKLGNTPVFELKAAPEKALAPPPNKDNTPLNPCINTTLKTPTKPLKCWLSTGFYSLVDTFTAMERGKYG
jgi:hypothetical protein